MLNSLSCLLALSLTHALFPVAHAHELNFRTLVTHMGAGGIRDSSFVITTVFLAGEQQSRKLMAAVFSAARQHGLYISATQPAARQPEACDLKEIEISENSGSVHY